MIEHNPDKEPPETNYKQEIVTQKLVECWGATFAKLGATNTNYAAKILYRSIYSPEKLNEIISAEQQGTERMVVLQEVLNRGPNTITPEENDFIEVITQTIKKDINYDDFIYEGALEIVENFAKHIPVTIWTAGDSVGSTEYPGSNQQLYKIALSRLGDVRRKAFSDPDNDSQRRRKDILSVSISDKKLQELSNIINKAKARRSGELIVVEDNLDNLISFIDLAKQQGLNIRPIWVRQGHHGKKQIAPEYLKRHGIVDINEISELSQVTKPELGSELIIDFDDVISNDDKVKIEMGRVVASVLVKNNWL